MTSSSLQQLTDTATPLITDNGIVNYIQVQPFILYHGRSSKILDSPYREQYEKCLRAEKHKNVLYLISLDLYKHCRENLTVLENDKRFVEIADLQIYIQDGVYTAIKYKVTFGRGYRLPRINYLESDG